VLVRPEGSGELVSSGIWHADDPERAQAFRAESEGRSFGAGVGLPGRVLASGRAEWVDDFTAEPAFPRAAHAAELGLHAAFAFPVLVGTEVVAVLEFFAPRSDGRDEDLLRIMAHIGTVLGRVIERTRAERALAAQNDALRELDRLKDEFVSLVSHELRTPLTSIRGYLELVLDDAETPLPHEHREFLGVVQRNADRLLRLVGDLLFVAQVDAGRLALERDEVDLQAVAAECVQAALPLAARREIDVALAGGPTVLEGDRARLAQLVDNLLSNAIKFTPDGGSVTLRVRAEDGRAALEVADSGIGIPGDELGGLFERFFRSSSARRAAIQGTGLGLVIVRAIAEAHDGSVTVTSREGEGTTFRVELPRHAPRQEAGESAPAARITLQEAL
jgi:signal transduction histidine kinase